MAADEVLLLDLKDLDAVLERAKAERWTELALLPTPRAGPPSYMVQRSSTTDGMQSGYSFCVYRSTISRRP